MFGNQVLLNRLIADDPKNPIKEKMGDNDVIRVLDVISSEYRNEWGRLIQHSDANVIFCDNLGSWVTENNKLRRYIHDSVRMLRKLKNRPAWNNKNGMTRLIYEDLIIKTKVAWKQLDNIRHIWLANKKKWEEKKAIKAELEKNENL